MMVRGTLLTVCAFAALPALCQTNAARVTDIYSIALVEAVDEMDRQWGHLGPNEDQTSLDYAQPVVYKDDSVPNQYPAVVGGRRFEYLTGGELLTRRKRMKKDFPVLVVTPATVVGSRVRVVVSVFWVHVFKRRLALAYSDWAEVYFRLDADEGEFVVDEVKLGGI